ncbi:MAG: NUDIX hydrolase [Syntrophales bacterium]|nr:NUDIX hydrolase [Syntrophales bacterium]
MEKSGSSPVYSCRIFQVYEEVVEYPNGRKSRFSRIEHAPCIAVVPINEKGELILIRQWRPAVGDYLIEIPAGVIDHGESVEECVQRELAEETGYRAGEITKLFEGYLVPGYCNEYMYFYLARNLVEYPLPPDEDEDVELIPVTQEEAENMIKNGRIKDTKTALGIKLALDFLNVSENI